MPSACATNPRPHHPPTCPRKLRSTIKTFKTGEGAADMSTGQ
jgi:hypothetical protein